MEFTFVKCTNLKCLNFSLCAAPIHVYNNIHNYVLMHAYRHTSLHIAAFVKPSNQTYCRSSMINTRQHPELDEWLSTTLGDKLLPKYTQAAAEMCQALEKKIKNNFLNGSRNVYESPIYQFFFFPIQSCSFVRVFHSSSSHSRLIFFFCVVVALSNFAWFFFSSLFSRLRAFHVMIASLFSFSLYIFFFVFRSCNAGNAGVAEA